MLDREGEPRDETQSVTAVVTKRMESERAKQPNTGTNGGVSGAAAPEPPANEASDASAPASASAAARPAAFHGAAFSAICRSAAPRVGATRDASELTDVYAAELEEKSRAAEIMAELKGCWATSGKCSGDDLRAEEVRWRGARRSIFNSFY